MKNILYLSSPEFSIFLSPENGEIKSLEFGQKSKARKWETAENVAK